MTGPVIARVRHLASRALGRAAGRAPLPAEPELEEPPDTPGREELVRRARAHPDWYQRIYLGRGLHTLDWPHEAYHETVWRLARAALPADLGGASVLDVGTNAGYFALAVKRRGASRVLGVDAESRRLEQAELCRRIWGLDVEYGLLDAHDLGALDEAFDLVLFTGILYHLKSPLTVLEEVGRLCRDAVLVETEVIPEGRPSRLYVRQGAAERLRVTRCTSGFMKLIEGGELNGDASNWWVPDTACVLGMLRNAGFRHFSRPCYPEKTRLLLAATKRESSLLDRQALG